MPCTQGWFPPMVTLQRSPWQPCITGRMQRLREIKRLPQGHTARAWQTWALTSRPTARLWLVGWRGWEYLRCLAEGWGHAVTKMQCSRPRGPIRAGRPSWHSFPAGLHTHFQGWEPPSPARAACPVHSLNISICWQSLAPTFLLPGWAPHSYLSLSAGTQGTPPTACPAAVPSLEADSRPSQNSPFSQSTGAWVPVLDYETQVGRNPAPIRSEP